jgi:hypothetical protein
MQNQVSGQFSILAKLAPGLALRLALSLILPVYILASVVRRTGLDARRPRIVLEHSMPDRGQDSDDILDAMDSFYNSAGQAVVIVNIGPA